MVTVAACRAARASSTRTETPPEVPAASPNHSWPCPSKSTMGSPVFRRRTRVACRPSGGGSATVLPTRADSTRKRFIPGVL